MATGSAPGYVLTSDASGVGTWQPAVGTRLAADFSSVFDDGSKIGIGTTEPEAKLHIEGKVKSVVDGVEFYMVPQGSIIMWSGSVSAIPDGWALCDGSNGTPDLQDNFIKSDSQSNYSSIQEPSKYKLAYIMKL